MRQAWSVRGEWLHGLQVSCDRQANFQCAGSGPAKGVLQCDAPEHRIGLTASFAGSARRRNPRIRLVDRSSVTGELAARRVAGIRISGRANPTGSRLTRSRSSLPGLKKGAYLAGSDTGVPDLGLRPGRARRKRSVKLPNPRISIRPPLERHAALCSGVRFPAKATSRSTRWICVCAIRWINSDFVIGPLSHRRPRDVLGWAVMSMSARERLSISPPSRRV